MAQGADRAPGRAVAITSGCPAGIGLEVTARALAALPEASVPLHFFGPPALLLEGARRGGVSASADGDVVTVGRVCVRCCGGPGWSGAPGVPDGAALEVQRASLLAAIAEAEAGRAGALLTAPIRKAALDEVPGGPWPGHTELLGARLGDGRGPPLMVFAGGPFLLGLATVHLPLREAPGALTPAGLDLALARLLDAVARYGGNAGQAPRLVVLGLNPHAGEGGRLGTEELDVIAPAVARARSAGIDVEGPLPADGFFGSVVRVGAVLPDAVLAMTHDQGLAPYKILAHGVGVNLTLGLTVPRTSPDHGTADAIAGTGRARAHSMAAAIRSAVRRAAPRSGPGAPGTSPVSR